MMVLFEASKLPWHPKQLKKNVYGISCGSIVLFNFRKLWITKVPDFKWIFFQSCLICSLCHWDSRKSRRYWGSSLQEVMCFTRSRALGFLSPMFLFSSQILWHPQKMISLKTYISERWMGTGTFFCRPNFKTMSKVFPKKIRKFFANMVFFSAKTFRNFVNCSLLF